MERQRRERRYVLPDEPTIIVHPNWAAKNGKFDCSIMSLSVLLDYRLEDNKEHSFEVRKPNPHFNGFLVNHYILYIKIASKCHSCRCNTSHSVHILRKRIEWCCSLLSVLHASKIGLVVNLFIKS